MPRARAAQRPTILGRVWTTGGMTVAMSLVPALAYAQPETEPPPAASAPEPAPTPAPEPAPAPVTLPPPPLTAAPQPSVDEEMEEKPAGHERTLLHHRFLFPAFVQSSVVVSYVGLRLRLGQTAVDNLPTAAGTTDISLVTFDQGLDLGVKLTDWLGVFVSGGVRTVVGTNLEALTYDGATYNLGAAGGAIARLFRNDRTGSQLSLRLEGGYNRGQVATLYPIFDRPVASAASALQSDLGQSIRTPFTTVRANGGIAFAQGISRLFGIQLSAAIGYSHLSFEPFDQARVTRLTTTNDELTYSLGFAPSVDFAALHVPIAVMPEYVLSRQASSAQIRGGGEFDTTHTVALGVYFTGAVNLQVGVLAEAQLGLAPVVSPVGGESDSPRLMAAELVLRYVW